MDEIACKPENRVGVLAIVPPAGSASSDVTTPATCHESDPFKVDNDSSTETLTVVVSPLPPMGSLTKSFPQSKCQEVRNLTRHADISETTQAMVENMQKDFKDVLTMMKEATNTAQKTAETVQNL